MIERKKRCVIVGGAPIGDYGRVKAYLSDNDDVICCDSGLRHREGLGVEPTLIVGDFDSHENPHADVETIVLPREKDDTDTFYAVKEAVNRGYDEFLLVGVIGGRLDHTLANLSILYYLDTIGKTAIAVDDYSEVEVVSTSATVDDSYLYFSLLNLSGEAEGITITGAKFPLENGSVTCDYQYAVSNEPLKGQIAQITIERGRLLLIKDI